MNEAGDALSDVHFLRGEKHAVIPAESVGFPLSKDVTAVLTWTCPWLRTAGSSLKISAEDSDEPVFLNNQPHLKRISSFMFQTLTEDSFLQ